MLNTIKLKCLYSEVTSVPDIKNIDAYKDMIKPLNYNFSLDKGAFYNSLGFKLFDNTAWSYLVQEIPSFNELIAFAPIILFFSLLRRTSFCRQLSEPALTYSLISWT